VHEKAVLICEFAAEALRVAAIKCAHASDDLLIGDDLSAERNIKIAISHLREGSKAFKEMKLAIGKDVA